MDVANTGSIVTPAYGGFRRCELDTVASLAKRIFSCEEVVQGTVQIRVIVRANVKSEKKNPQKISLIDKQLK